MCLLPGPSTFATTSLSLKQLHGLYCAAVVSEAMAPVADKLELLLFLGRHPPQLTPQQASTCQKAALLAVGDHIDSRLPARYQDLVQKSHMWGYVFHSTEHRMSGEQLQGLYLGLKGQREREQAAAHERPEEGQGRGAAVQDGDNNALEGCMAAAQALAHAAQSRQLQAEQAAGSEVLPAMTGQVLLHSLLSFDFASMLLTRWGCCLTLA
jgi:hypothetical protein